jgi:anti-sigma factor RsiW
MSDETRANEAELHAYADGRLEAARRDEVEAWLALHPEDAERVAAWQRARAELLEHYAPVLDEPVPEALERAARGRAASGPFLRKAMLAAAWMAIGAALGAIAGWQLHGSLPKPAVATESNTTMARRAAVAHAVYSPEVRHPVEVGADQEQHLIAWLSKRTGVKLKAPKLDESGMALVGGRLLPGETGPVAQFMYQNERGRRITLYVRAETAPTRETSFRYVRENSVGVFYWIDRNSSYAIASGDLSKEELLAVANVVYKQLEP